jgi:hypothetical protein
MDAGIWPSPREFWEAIQAPQVCFTDPSLRNSSAAVDKLGLPLVASGGFASVFKLNAADGSSAKAVRCFRGALGDRERRYRELSTHLSNRRDLPLARFEYVPEGMVVRGNKYPILVMDWVEGSTLDVYVAEALKLPDAKRHLRHLADQWLQTVGALHALGAAHGDLQHGNILVNNGSYTLVDFDGFFAPSLAGLPAIETGHLNYQHPQRRAEYFDSTLDRFSELVIYLSLIALERRPELWLKYHDENLLFKRADFEAPGRSPLWGELKKLDFECRHLVEVLERACVAPAQDCPFLLDLVRQAIRTSPASAGHLGTIVAPTREVDRVRPVTPKVTVPRANASVAVRQRAAAQVRPVLPAAPALLPLCSAWMAVVAAAASFVPLLQPWILGIGVVLIGGGWPVLGQRKIVGRFTAAWGLLALMAIGTPVGWMTAAMSSPSPARAVAALTPARSLAAPLTQGSQPPSTAPSEKVDAQVADHIAAAQELFQHSEFANALLECDRALAIDHKNAQARWLKDQISKTRDTLQGKAH